ncbi:MAG: hypothetical protein PHU51_04160, partial [Candidatus Nanoarchaeia archaeon]|nr:hypothetical protein [Candidatus Nanoarchaeia archaeon]
MKLDKEKGKIIIKKLHDSFYKGEGIFENINDETLLKLNNVEIGCEKHLIWLTLSSTLDYSRDADKLWASTISAFQNKDSGWIYDVF